MGELSVIDVSLSDLRTAGVQTRASMRQGAIEEYAAVLNDGGSLDAGVVFRDGHGTLHLAAGHHRRAAHALAGRQAMPCEVREGTKWDAIQFGINDNQQHRGERLTRADRRHNAELVLAEQPGMSDRAIAELCRVSHPSVSTWRRQLEGKSRQVPERQPEHVDGRGGCRCGGEWVSDGNGGRYCEKCTANHPTTLSVVDGDEPAGASDFLADDAPVQSPHVERQPARSKPSSEMLFEEAIKHLGLLKRTLDKVADLVPGPDYPRTMEVLDLAGERIQQWREGSLSG